MTVSGTADAHSGEAGHADQVRAGERFKFGAYWQRFLLLLDERRIANAEESQRTMLEFERLDGRTFQDAGSGSGLFSLAARRLVSTLGSGCNEFAFTRERPVGQLSRP